MPLRILRSSVGSFVINTPRGLQIINFNPSTSPYGASTLTIENNNFYMSSVFGDSQGYGGANSISRLRATITGTPTTTAWYQNGSLRSGGTPGTSTLYAPTSGTIELRVTNSSLTAYLSSYYYVDTTPVFTLTPQSVFTTAVSSSSTQTFSALAASAHYPMTQAGISYQWYNSSGAIANATSTVFSTTAYDNSYSVVASSCYGSVSFPFSYGNFLPLSVLLVGGGGASGAVAQYGNAGGGGGGGVSTKTLTVPVTATPRMAVIVPAGAPASNVSPTWPYVGAVGTVGSAASIDYTSNSFSVHLSANGGTSGPNLQPGWSSGTGGQSGDISLLTAASYFNNTGSYALVSNSNFAMPGGGGAGGIGQDATIPVAGWVLGGAGGAGLTASLNGRSFSYGGGGGGGAYSSTGTRGLGTAGGGSGSDPWNWATDGTANTGGGGGGGPVYPNTYTTKGGSGAVVLSYNGPQCASGGSVSYYNSYVFHTFNKSGYFYVNPNLYISQPYDFMGNLSTNLTVAPSGIPPYDITWYKDNAVLAGSKSSSLSLSGSNNNGTYYAVITSLYGSITSESANYIYSPITGFSNSVSASDGYQYFVFTSSDSITFTQTVTADIMVVGGGGGGGEGGGGAGGVVYQTATIQPQTCVISIGAGGAGSTTGTQESGALPGSNGSDSSFISNDVLVYYKGLGGGGGGMYKGANGVSGGSGGGSRGDGGSGTWLAAYGSGLQPSEPKGGGYGNRGGNGWAQDGLGGPGGGGGAGAVGGDFNLGSYVAGDGGAGTSLFSSFLQNAGNCGVNINGTYYIAGGGGRTGGNGGGGSRNSTASGSGFINTGGGGAWDVITRKPGGSGLVIVRIRKPS